MTQIDKIAIFSNGRMKLMNKVSILATNHCWLIPKPRANPRLRLICFSYAGGSANTFANWHQQLPEDVEVIALQLPGRAHRLQEPPFNTMDELVDDLLRQISLLTSVPYLLFGHSLGSRVAYEFAIRAQQQGLPAPLHVIASGSKAPHLAPTKPAIHHLPEKEFVQELRDLNGTPEEILQQPELLQLLLPMLRADFKIAQEYQAKIKTRLHCPVTVLSGIDDIDMTDEMLRAWNEVTTYPATIHKMEGDHFFIEQYPSQLLKKMNAIILATATPQPQVY